MALLALSRHLSFHARGDAAFVWHGLTGDVAEMSRDVVALLLAFEPAAEEAAVAAQPPAGLTREQVEEFAAVLRSRRFLVLAASGGRAVDEITPLLAGVPRVPRATVFERTDPGVTLYTRRGEALPLAEPTASLFLRCDGEHTLGQVLGDAGPSALPDLLRLARADLSALKILAKPASQGGVHLNPAAESTMPYPEIPDVRAWVEGGLAPAPPPSDEPTFAQLFDRPHPSLGGATFAEAVAKELERRGAFRSARGRKPRVVEIELGFGLRDGLRRALGETELVTVNPLGGAGAVQAEPSKLPFENESVDAVVACELGAFLRSSPGEAVVNTGAVELVREAARVLAPGGVLFLEDFGDPSAAPQPAGPGMSTRFADLQAAAQEAGLGARVVPITEAINMDPNFHALATTKASFPALAALFAAHGIELSRRAWLRSEIEALAEGKLDLSRVHGLTWQPLSERALGLSPRQFWALVAQKPERVLH